MFLNANSLPVAPGGCLICTHAQVLHSRKDVLTTGRTACVHHHKAKIGDSPEIIHAGRKNSSNSREVAERTRSYSPERLLATVMT